VDRDIPEGMDLHLIVDDYSTHKHPKVKQWIAPAQAIPFAFHSHQLFLLKLGEAL
jgi:hypothetical protein